MALTRPVRLQLAFAILFIVLGIGNIIFGTFRAREYRRALFQATQVVTQKAPFGSEERDALSAEANPIDDVQSGYLTQIRARYEFYLFVAVGGKWMLALAGFFLLLSLVGMAEQNGSEEKQELDQNTPPSDK